MVIYADVLVALNFILTYLTLLGTCAVLRTAPSARRMLAASAFGGAASLSILLPELGTAASVLLKCAVAAVTVLLAFHFDSPRLFLRRCGVCTALQCALAGAAFAVRICTGTDAIRQKNGALYVPMHFTGLVITAIVCYALLRVGCRVLAKSEPGGAVCPVELEVEGVRISVNALQDTGNALRDDAFGAPVAVVWYDAVRDRLPLPLLPFFAGDLSELPQANCPWRERLRVLPVRTVSGSRLLPCFRCDAMQITTADGTYRRRRILIAVTNEPAPDGAYNALIGPELTDEAHQTKTEKDATAPCAREQERNCS